MNGYEAVYLNNKSQFDYTKLRENDIAGDEVDLEYGFTDSNLNFDEFELENNGIGFGLDLGFTYTHGENPENYDWKIGFSILDIGKIRFSENAQQHAVRQLNPTIVDTDLFTSFNGVDEANEYVQIFSQQTLGDSTASLVGNQFDVWLPQAFSFQFDKAFANNWYIGAAIVEQIPIGDQRLQRGGLMVVSPRYETRWFGASIPVSLYNWEKVNYGLALRLGFLSLGTDNLGSMIENKDFSGSDFYVALKINPFQWGGDDDNKGWINRWKSGNKKKGKVRCFEFD